MTHLSTLSRLYSLNFNLLNHLACAYRLFLVRLKQTQPITKPHPIRHQLRQDYLAVSSFLGCENRQELATIFRTITSLTMKPPMRPHVT